MKQNIRTHTIKCTPEELIAINCILQELRVAEEKHPKWPTKAIDQAAIVCEESGELIRAALKMKYEDGDPLQFENEAIQTGAMCIRILKNLKD